MNPYRWLATNARALLRNELPLNAEERNTTQWLMTVDVLDRKFMIGRGGANTCFWQVGDSQRHIGYPNDLLTMLDTLAKQGHIGYKIHYRDGRCQTFLARKAALRVSPNDATIIEGINEDNSVNRLFLARKNIGNEAKWIKA